jgi:hypothetical protein
MASEYQRVNPSPMLSRHIYLRDKMTCQYCATQRASRYVLEHVIPVAKGGPTAAYNLVVACERCNQVKGTKVWEPLNLDTLTEKHPAWRHRIDSLAEPQPPAMINSQHWSDYLRGVAREHNCESWHVAYIAVWEMCNKYQDQPEALEALIRAQLPPESDSEPEPEPDYEEALQAYAA